MIPFSSKTTKHRSLPANNNNSKTSSCMVIRRVAAVIVPAAPTLHTMPINGNVSSSPRMRNDDDHQPHRRHAVVVEFLLLSSLRYRIVPKIWYKPIILHTLLCKYETMQKYSLMFVGGLPSSTSPTLRDSRVLTRMYGRTIPLEVLAGRCRKDTATS